MLTVLNLFVLQGIMGAFDNLWHHEFTEKLPGRPTAWKELILHSARGALYSIIFLSLGWLELSGFWAGLLIAILIIEVGITLWDFVEEDMTRTLPATERVLHTLLALNYGAILGLLLPILWHWSGTPTDLQFNDYGWQSRVMTLYGVGIIGFAVRDGIAAYTLHGKLKPEWQRHPYDRPAKPSGRTVLLTGATGFIGRSVARALIARGDELIVATRDADKGAYVFGSRARTVTSFEEISSTTRVDAIVNLAGEPVVGLPWTKRRRKTIVESRTTMIDNLLDLVRRLETKPDCFVQASAVGYYGDQADRELSEDAEPCERRFACVSCLKTEARARIAEVHGLRTVLLRFGLVLGTGGGAFPGLALAAKFGLGSILGRGDQWMAWIHLDDAVAMVLAAMDNDALIGPVNAAAPEPVTQQQFTKTLGKTLHRPVFLKVPAIALRTGLGEMSDIFLASTKVVPQTALQAGFTFRYPDIATAMADLCKLPAPRQQKAGIGTTEMKQGGSPV